MNRNDFGLIKNYTSAGAIAPNRLVAFSGERTSRDFAKVVVANAGTAALAGVSGVLGTVKADERIDVYKADIQMVEFGGEVSPGDPITADTEGRGVKAEPAAGDTVRIIGFAEEPGNQGSLGAVHILPQFMRG